MRYLFSLFLVFIPYLLLAESTSYSKLTYNEDTVDLIEINHFLDEKGRIVFDQIVFFDYDEYSSRYLVRDWRLIKDGRKSYSQEEATRIKKEKKQEWFKEEKIPGVLQEYYEDICVWNPEYGYSKNLNIDHINKRVIWQDNDFLRKVKYRETIVETTTQYDPELINRNLLDKEFRAKLRTYNPATKSQISDIILKIQNPVSDIE